MLLLPKRIIILGFTLAITSCATQNRYCPTQPIVEGLISQKQLIQDLETISSDDMEGRLAGSTGSQKAAEFIVKRFQQSGLTPLDKPNYTEGYFLPFKYGSNKQKSGINIVGLIEGSVHPEQYLVVTAHYDHLGKSGSKVFNGADDNASGVSGMLSLATHFSKNKPRHSIIFLATDAEEPGLYGSKAFVNNPPVKLDNIKFNLNLDMIGRGEVKNKLYISGLRRNKHLRPLIENSLKQTNVCIVKGHEGRSGRRVGSTQATNWDNASDHAPFLKKKIPYLYFGVDLHKDYHQSSDTYEKISPDFFTATVESIIKIFGEIDRGL